MKYAAGAILIICGVLLIAAGLRRLSILRRCRERIAGRYMDRESVSSFRGEKFRLKFEYEYEGKLYTSFSDGKFAEKDVINRGFTRGRRYEILISPENPSVCTCRLKNEYIFEVTFLLMAGFFAAAAGVLFLI